MNLIFPKESCWVLRDFVMDWGLMSPWWRPIAITDLGCVGIVSSKMSLVRVSSPIVGLGRIGRNFGWGDVKATRQLLEAYQQEMLFYVGERQPQLKLDAELFEPVGKRWFRRILSAAAD